MSGIPNLPVPSFVETNPATVEDELVTAYEHAVGRKLYDGQLERLLIHEFAYRESLLRTVFQGVAQQNLLAYAVYPVLDYLADLVGVARLPAAAAEGMVTLTAVDPPAEGVAVLAGWRVSPPGGAVVFETTESVLLTDLELSAEVGVRAVTAGAAGNGFEVGDNWDFVDGMPYLEAVTVSAVTAGGADEETDDSLRERIRLAPHSWSVAGAKNAYIKHAKSVSTLVIDVYPESWDSNPALAEGLVRVHVLSSPLLLGTPEGDAEAAALVLAVDAFLRRDDIKPLCEQLDVVSATIVDVTVTMDVVRYADADAAIVATEVAAAFEGYRIEVRSALGRDFVPSMLASMLQTVEGVYSVTVTVPGGVPVAVGPSEVALVSGYTINHSSSDEVMP